MLQRNSAPAAAMPRLIVLEISVRTNSWASFGSFAATSWSVACQSAETFASVLMP